MSPEIALRKERLRAAREQKGFSQRELARRCGFSEAQIRRYETGEFDPSSTYLKSIARQLEISTDYLLGIVDEPRGYFGTEELSDDERVVLETLRREGWLGIIRLGTEKIAK